MEGNQGDVTRVDSRTLNLPSGLIRAELEGLYGTNVLSDMKEIIDLYDIYERGAPFPVETQGDYVPANLKYKSISALVNKEARFLFSKPRFLGGCQYRKLQGGERTGQGLLQYLSKIS